MTDDLREQITDAVADVEPADRLAEIRARTAERRRPWGYVAGGVALAAAAAVAAVVVLPGDGADPGPDVAGDPGPSVVVPVYYQGGTPQGPRLFREFDRVAGTDPVAAALDLLATSPADPDYRTTWEPGTLLGATLADDVIEVRVASGGGYDDLATQQLVYTVQAALGSRAPVQLVSRDGEALGGPVAARPALEVLSHVSLSDPAEGRSVRGSFTARGVASSPEATVPWELRRGDEVVRDGFATAEGWSDRLHPWEVTVDVSGLEPGAYTFVARTADESGDESGDGAGGEGPGPDVDTRTVVVE